MTLPPASPVSSTSGGSTAMSTGSLTRRHGRGSIYSHAVALPRVVLLRGYSANPWDLRPLALLRDRYDLSVLVTRRNEWEADRLGVPAVPVRALRDLLPKGRLANAAAYAASDRYLHADEHLQGAALVHAAELGSWFSAQAAQLKQRLGFRLAVTVW